MFARIRANSIAIAFLLGSKIKALVTKVETYLFGEYRKLIFDASLFHEELIKASIEKGVAHKSLGKIGGSFYYVSS